MLGLPHPDWQRKVEEYNSANGWPPTAIFWNPRSIKKLVQSEIYGVAVKREKYEPRWEVGIKLPYVPEGMEKLAQYIDGSGGEWFIKLFSWCVRDEQGRDAGFADLDDRLFSLLRYSDSARSRRHYEETVVEPEEKRTAGMAKAVRDLTYAARSYHWGRNNPVVSMNPEIRSGGDWRWRER